MLINYLYKFERPFLPGLLSLYSAGQITLTELDEQWYEFWTMEYHGIGWNSAWRVSNQ